MRPCPSCGCHVRGPDRACPSCHAPVPQGRSGSVAALLLGLSVACVGGTTTDKATDLSDTDTYTSPDYGVPYTDYGDADTDSDSDTDADTDADTDTDPHSGHSGGHSSAR